MKFYIFMRFRNFRLNLIKFLVTKPIQYIHISQWNYFKIARRGEGASIERLKVIHEITKGKMPLIGVGKLRTEKDLNNAMDSGFSEFFAIGTASIINRDFGILLKENKGDKIEVEIDPEKEEKYKLSKTLWNMGLAGMLPVKGKVQQEYDP